MSLKEQPSRTNAGGSDQTAGRLQALQGPLERRGVPGSEYRTNPARRRIGGIGIYVISVDMRDVDVKAVAYRAWMIARALSEIFKLRYLE